jgi:hypothetical protein
MRKQMLVPGLLCLLLAAVAFSGLAHGAELGLNEPVEMELCVVEVEEAGDWYEEPGLSDPSLNNLVSITISGDEDAADVYSLETIAAAVNATNWIYTVGTYEIVYEYDEATATRTVNIVDCPIEPVEGEEVEPVEGEEVEPVEGEDVEPVEGEDVEPVEGEDVEPVEGEDVEPVEGEDVEPVEGEDVVEPVEGEDVVEPVEGEDTVDPEEGEDEDDASGCAGFEIGLGAVLLGGLTLLALWIGSMLMGGPVWPPVNF